MANVIAAIGRRARHTRAALAVAALAALAGCAEPTHLIGLNMVGTEDSYSVARPAHFWAIAVYSDGATEQVTTAAEWTSSDTSVATVTMEFDRVLIHFAVPGSVVVTATYENVSASVTLTVAPP